MAKQRTIEDRVLHAVDLAAERAGDWVTRQLVDLFKSAILRKYKVAYDQELSRGEVQQEHLEKAVDFCFADACITYRQLQIEGVDDERKEEEITRMNQMLCVIKENVKTVLECNGINVVK